MRYRSPAFPVAPVTPANNGDAAPARELSVVHSSFGRLRVHLPYWSGTREAEITAEVRRLAGVTHAEASPITGNLLILFAPRQTSAHTLLRVLPHLSLDVPDWPSMLGTVPEPPPAAIAEIRPHAALLADAHGPPDSTGYVTGTGRVIYQLLGWTSVGLAVIGAITPGIPTAPFVVIAGYFFIRSSPEAHRWLRESRWFGPILRDWEEYRAVRRSVRNAAVGLILFGMGFIVLLGLPATLTATILTLQFVGLVIVLSLRVVEAPEVGALPAASR
jgi:uncharacterized membrane protein YbaN (DUF454 family)